jgi:hypothetical protein
MWELVILVMSKKTGIVFDRTEDEFFSTPPLLKIIKLPSSSSIWMPYHHIHICIQVGLNLLSSLIVFIRKFPLSFCERSKQDSERDRNICRGQKPLSATRLSEVRSKSWKKSGNSPIYVTWLCDGRSCLEKRYNAKGINVSKSSCDSNFKIIAVKHENK